jgi:hypothetical protein
MNSLKKPLLLLLSLTCGVAAMVWELSRPATLQHAFGKEHGPEPAASHSEMLAQLEVLKTEKNASLTKAAALEVEVRRLKNQVAVLTGDASVPTGQAQPRHPQARQGGESGESNPEETPFAKSVLDLAIKAGRLNAQILQHPEWDIPELQYLDEGEWIHFAKEADLDSEAGVSKALADLRKTAKSRFADLAREALAGYAKANGGQAPSSINQLLPYLPDSLQPGVLERYQLIPANSPQRPASTDIGGPMILREKSAVDPLYDTSFDIGPAGWSSTSVGTGYVLKQFR